MTFEEWWETYGNPTKRSGAYSVREIASYAWDSGRVNYHKEIVEETREKSKEMFDVMQSGAETIPDVQSTRIDFLEKKAALLEKECAKIKGLDKDIGKVWDRLDKHRDTFKKWGIDIE